MPYKIYKLIKHYVQAQNDDTVAIKWKSTDNFFFMYKIPKRQELKRRYDTKLKNILQTNKLTGLHITCAILDKNILCNTFSCT